MHKRALGLLCTTILFVITIQSSKSLESSKEIVVSSSPRRENISLTCPGITAGLEVKLSGRKVVILPGVVWVNDNPVRIFQPKEVAIPNCPMVKAENEPVQLTTETLMGPASKTILAFCRASNGDLAAIDNVLVPGSVRVKSAKSSNANFYRSGIDFLLDGTWGAITRTPASTIKEKQTVYVDYVYFTRRLDTLVVDEKGNIFLVSGKPSRCAPEPGMVNTNLLQLARIFAKPANLPLAREDFLPIASQEGPKHSIQQRTKNREGIKRTLAKLKAGEQVNIVFWGDSITSGGDASNKKCGFTEVFLSKLRSKYPASSIFASNAGIGGTSTKNRLPKFEEEVLAKKPDLIVLEFINDVHLSKDELEANYNLILSKAHAGNHEILLVNPHFPHPKLLGFPGWKDVIRNPYFQFVRNFAESNNLAAADITNRWEHLDREGLRPDILLADKLIHLNDQGHKIYAEELFKCFN